MCAEHGLGGLAYARPRTERDKVLDQLTAPTSIIERRFLRERPCTLPQLIQ
jgi:hypothetical protein